MNIGYILFWTVFSVLVGILYYLFSYTNNPFKAKVEQNLSKIFEPLKIQTSRGIFVIRGILAKIFEPLKIQISRGIFVIRGILANISQDSSSSNNKSGESIVELYQARISQFFSSIAMRLGHRMAGGDGQGQRRERLLNILEVVIIVIWALWITLPYADFNTNMWPAGGDFPRNVQLFSTWQSLPICGDCVLWNGSINGGAPAFADIFTPVLNPLLIVTTILFDVLTASKLILIISFMIAGLAQLWLGRVLGLGRIARLWIAAIAVAGGQLSGRMEMGHIAMVIPIAAASLMLPAALDVARTGRRRSVVLLALTMSMMLVSGHGYIQIAVMVGFLPALLIYFFDSQMRFRPVWRSFIWAAILTICLTAIFWLPLVRFWPLIQKDGDLTFSHAQAVNFAVTNLFIGDLQFLHTPILGRWDAPGMYTMYIGWIPILLVFFAFRFVPRREIRTMAVLVLAIFLIYLASSGVVFRWFADTIGQFFSMGRDPSLMQPIAIPMILALSGWGLDGLLRLHWPKLTITQGRNQLAIYISLVMLMIIPLIWGLNSLVNFTRDFVRTVEVNTAEEYPMDAFKSPYARWVAMPFGDFYSFPMAIGPRLKIIIHRDFTAWNWANRDVPLPEVELTRDPVYRSDPAYTRDVGPFIVLEHPDRQYASVQTTTGLVPCQATAIGGHIDVLCRTKLPGLLMIQENNYSGWQALVNDRPAEVTGDHISVQVPAGSSQIQLRYRPWDMIVGGVLTLIGFILCIWIWWRPIWGLPEAVPLEDLMDAEAIESI
jgi:hypothetical protein